MHKFVFFVTEGSTLTMKDLHRYVIETHAPDWKTIGLELNLKASTLNIIEKDNPLKCTVCFEKTLDMWLRSTPHATWRILEVAIANVQGAHLGVEPLPDANGRLQRAVTQLAS